MLLGREDITPDTGDEDRRTPLSWAAEYLEVLRDNRRPYVI